FGSITTRSPGRSPPALSPASATTPQNSWPRIVPTSAGNPGGSETMCRSVPQIPTAATRMITSSSRPISGFGISCTPYLPTPWKTTARIVLAPFRRLGARRAPALLQPAVRQPAHDPALQRDPEDEHRRHRDHRQRAHVPEVVALLRRLRRHHHRQRLRPLE